MPAFDIDAEMIRRLAGLIDETGLTEIEFDDGRRRIRVARNGAGVVAVAPAAAAAPAQPAPAAAEGPQVAALDASHPGAVTSPMVGTAYLGSEPGAPAFVKVGDRIAKGDVLLIVEAMKVMNQIPAPHGGTVKQILVANGSPVEFGELLMIIE